MHFFDELQSHQRFLLLQSPVGHFFQALRDFLTKQHKCVYKINLNGGDEHYFPPVDRFVIAYQGQVEEWREYLSNFLQKHAIEAVVVFGDCRVYHRIAKALCDELGIAFYVFEEGYFRPYFITLEKDGVNDHSPLPRDASYFLNQVPLLEKSVQQLGKTFQKGMAQSIVYYIAMYRHRHRFPHYQHHRMTSLWGYSFNWVRGFFRKLAYWYREKCFAKKVRCPDFPPFFLVTLQTYNDCQLIHHSHYQSVESYLKEILENFRLNAPENTYLIIKHHPMDRGFKHYQAFIHTCIKNTLIEKRVFYVFDVNLPLLLHRAKGVVTLNSTSGLSALIHGKPTILLGRANYDFKGMTYQGELSQFWRNPEPPSNKLVKQYRLFHMYKTQLNTNFHCENHSIFNQ